MVTYSQITDAHQRLTEVVINTPIIESVSINKQLGGRLLFKVEALQRTGSFKFRGAYNKISQLAQNSDSGIVAYSSGNHAQGVALAASLFNLPATIIMPADSPRIKINNTKALGGEVILYDRYTQSREEIGQSLAQEGNLALVKPYDDLDIIAGQGTAGLEASHQLDKLGLKPDQVIVPCGGGGLISGTSIAIHKHFPKAKIWAAEPEHYDDAKRSLAAGERVSNNANQPSLCDSIVTPTPGELTFPIMQAHLEGGLVVNEEQVLQAMASCMQELKVVVEPGGCAGLAALFAGLLPTQNKTTLVILSGGNADPDILARSLKHK